MSLTLPRFYRSEDELVLLHHRLKLTLCPWCKATETLILHGSLYGYVENDDCRKSRRGRRIFCNNRKRRNNGCGHTFSVWAAATIKRLRLSASTLWKFIQLVLILGNKAAALRELNADFSISSAYRIWKRVVGSQSHVRTALTRCCRPPDLAKAGQPVQETVAHLEAAFPSEPCPIVAFQQQLQICFL
jgi:hypothetical protein